MVKVWLYRFREGLVFAREDGHVIWRDPRNPMKEDPEHTEELRKYFSFSRWDEMAEMGDCTVEELEMDVWPFEEPSDAKD